MGEAFGDPEQLDVIIPGLRFQVEAGPFAEAGRITTQIDSNVPYMAREYPDEFSLRLSELVVQTSEDAFYGKGLVVLDKLGWETGHRKGFLTKYFCEPTATISKALGLNQLYVFKVCVNNPHGNSLASEAFPGIFCLRFPFWHIRKE